MFEPSEVEDDSTPMSNPFLGCMSAQDAARPLSDGPGRAGSPPLCPVIRPRSVRGHRQTANCPTVVPQKTLFSQGIVIAQRPKRDQKAA
jgi:hypothetical protein